MTDIDYGVGLSLKFFATDPGDSFTLTYFDIKAGTVVTGDFEYGLAPYGGGNRIGPGIGTRLADNIMATAGILTGEDVGGQWGALELSGGYVGALGMGIPDGVDGYGFMLYRAVKVRWWDGGVWWVWDGNYWWEYIPGLYVYGAFQLDNYVDGHPIYDSHAWPDYDLLEDDSNVWVCWVGQLYMDPGDPGGGLVAYDLADPPTTASQPPFSLSQKCWRIVLIDSNTAFVAAQDHATLESWGSVVNLSAQTKGGKLADHTAGNAYESQNPAVAVSHTAPIGSGDPVVAYVYSDGTSVKVAFIVTTTGSTTTVDIGTPWGVVGGSVVAPVGVCFTKDGTYAFVVGNSTGVGVAVGVSIKLSDMSHSSVTAEYGVTGLAQWTATPPPPPPTVTDEIVMIT